MRNALVRHKISHTLMIILATVALQADPASGEQAVIVRSSSTTITLVAELAEEYREMTGQAVLVEGGGASKGLDASLANDHDLFFLSEESRQWDNQEDLAKFPIAYDAATLIVNTKNPVTNLTLQQAQQIFSGEQTFWGHGDSITAFAPPTVLSPARECFEQTALGQQPISQHVRVEPEPFIPQQIGDIPGAIGLLTAGTPAPDAPIKVLTVDGIAPTADNLLNKSYPLRRTLTFAAREQRSNSAQAFIDFVLSERGQQIIHEAGYLPLGSATPAGSVQQTAEAQISSGAEADP